MPHARSRRGWVLSVVLSALAGAFVLANRVFVEFEPARIRLVASPLSPGDRAVTLDVPASAAGALTPPIAVIARLRHDGPRLQTFSIHLDDTPVCQPAVRGGRPRRIDCSAEAGWASGRTHQIRIGGPPAPWTIEYLELATHHGRSTGPFTAFILPAGSTRYTRPHWIWPVVAGLAIAGLLGWPRGLLPQAAERGARAMAIAVTALFVLLLIAPLISPYRVVLSRWTFAGAAGLLLLPYLARPVQRVWRVARVSSGVAAGAAAAALLAFALLYGSRALGAADTYGYVSQADLWLRGSLETDQASALDAPWPQPAWTFTPLGYRPHHADARVIVPTYAPGLPLLLAAAKWAGGQGAMFTIVPLCGALLVLATYGLGRRLEAAPAGAAAAWLMATSPIVLGHVTIAMSDVPAAAFWSAAVYLALGPGLRNAIGAGLLSSVAILIRPNLAPLASVLALRYALQWRTHGRWRAAGRLLAFAGAVLPGVVAIAAINDRLYGSPLASGYGSLDQLFAWSRVGTNLRNYTGWIADAHTPVIFAGLVAMLLPSRRLWPGVRAREVSLVTAAFVGVVWTIYCAWHVFDSWWYTRFLLPTLPFMVLGVGAVASALGRHRSPWAAPAALCGVVALCVFQVTFSARSDVFAIPRLERRNVAIARLTERLTPARAVIFSRVHTGSVRYYAGRTTLNYVFLDERWLDDAVAWLVDQGAHPYAMLEHWEVEEFRRRFGSATRVAALEAGPVAVFQDPGRAMLFDLAPSQPHATIVVTGADLEWTAVPPAPAPRLSFRSRLD